MLVTLQDAVQLEVICHKERVKGVDLQECATLFYLPVNM